MLLKWAGPAWVDRGMCVRRQDKVAIEGQKSRLIVSMNTQPIRVHDTFRLSARDAGALFIRN